MDGFDEADHLELLYLVEKLHHLALPLFQLPHRRSLVEVPLEAICYKKALSAAIARIE